MCNAAAKFPGRRQLQWHRHKILKSHLCHPTPHCLRTAQANHAHRQRSKLCDAPLATTRHISAGELIPLTIMKEGLSPEASATTKQVQTKTSV